MEHETENVGNPLHEAEVALDAVDAEIARWYVHDGQLSEDPLDGPLSSHARSLRERRLAAVARLERAGGHDPHRSFTELPTEAQRVGWRTRTGEPSRGDVADPIRFLLDGLGVADLAELHALVEAARCAPTLLSDARLIFDRSNLANVPPSFRMMEAALYALAARRGAA